MASTVPTVLKRTGFRPQWDDVSRSRAAGPETCACRDLRLGDEFPAVEPFRMRAELVDALRSRRRFLSATSATALAPVRCRATRSAPRPTRRSNATSRCAGIGAAGGGLHPDRCVGAHKAREKQQEGAGRAQLASAKGGRDQARFGDRRETGVVARTEGVSQWCVRQIGSKTAAH
jgi:hypothetical protein